MITPHRISGTTSRYCVPHARMLKEGQDCPMCPKATRGVYAAPAPVVKRPRAGSDTEALLASQLCAAGYFDATFAERPNAIGRDMCFRRECPWGIELEPERGFRFDVVFTYYRVAVEIMGGSHAAGRAKVKSDVERGGLAASLGWRVVTITPESVRDGTAVALIARALSINNAPAGEGGKS